MAILVNGSVVAVGAPREYCIGLRDRGPFAADAGYDDPPGVEHGDEVLAALRAVCRSAQRTWATVDEVRRDLLRRAARDERVARGEASLQRAAVRQRLANDLPYVLAALERAGHLESRSTARMPGAPAFHYS